MNQPAHTYLGFDFGTRKIGVAVGQTITGTASPLPEIKCHKGKPDWQLIEKLCAVWKPDGFVVGLPYNMDGSESEMSRRARKFVNQLQGRINLPCYTVDERLSSREAREISRNSAKLRGVKYDQMQQVDSLAAQLILESWMSLQPPL
ncbi:MAG: Holliday junction resolvase RuvX [Pseudohongiellaceae bacterium]